MNFSDVRTNEYKDGIQTWCIALTNTKYAFDLRVIYDDYGKMHYICESPIDPELIELTKIFVGKETLYRTTDKELYEIIKSQYPHLFKNV